MRLQVMTFEVWLKITRGIIQVAGGDPDELPFDFAAYFEKGWGALEVVRQYLNELTRAKKQK